MLGGVTRPRVLVSLLVERGDLVRPEELDALAATASGAPDVEVLVLDGGDPDGVSGDERRAGCLAAGFAYYRPPAPLGRPRATNLALGRALAGGYDFVLLVDAGVVVSPETLPAMIRAAEANARVGSVTAWTAGPSRYALANDDPDLLAARPDTARWVASVLGREFGSTVLDVPAGESFCLLLPVPVVQRVGLFDPVYGSGSDGEVDWSLRSRTLGYRAALAPAAFVARRGRVGPDGPGGRARAATAATEQRDVVDLRYRWHRADLDAFASSGALDAIADRALRVILVQAAQRSGYEVEATWAPSPPGGDRVGFVVDPDGRARQAEAVFAGFHVALPVPGGDLPALLLDTVGAAPSRIVVHDRGLFAEQLAARWGDSVPFEDRCRYPQRI